MSVSVQTGECEPRRGQRGSCQHQHQNQLQHSPNRVGKPKVVTEEKICKSWTSILNAQHIVLWLKMLI